MDVSPQLSAALTPSASNKHCVFAEGVAFLCGAAYVWFVILGTIHNYNQGSSFTIQLYELRYYAYSYWSNSVGQKLCPIVHVLVNSPFLTWQHYA